jgi:hypothetical protein
MITLQNFPKQRAPEIFCQIYPLKVPPAGIYTGKVPVQEWKTAHVALLLPPIGRSLLLGLFVSLSIMIAASLVHGDCAEQ